MIQYNYILCYVGKPFLTSIHCCVSVAGTVIYVPKAGSSYQEVTVVWDNGREARYRAGQDGNYDLRLLDNATIGAHRVLLVLCQLCVRLCQLSLNI